MSRNVFKTKPFSSTLTIFLRKLIDRNILPAFALQHIKVEQQDITIMEYNSWGQNPRCFVTWTSYIYIYRLIYKRNTIWLIWQASPYKERSTKSVKFTDNFHVVFTLTVSRIPISLFVLSNNSSFIMLALYVCTILYGPVYLINQMTGYLFSFFSFKGAMMRNELLFWTRSPFTDFILATPGLQEGERTKTEDLRWAGLDSWDSSEMIDILSSSSSGWKTVARAELPWKHTISTCSCRVEAR